MDVVVFVVVGSLPLCRGGLVTIVIATPPPLRSRSLWTHRRPFVMVVAVVVTSCCRRRPGRLRLHPSRLSSSLLSPRPLSSRCRGSRRAGLWQLQRRPGVAVGHDGISGSLHCRCAGDGVDGVAYRVAAGSRQVGVVRVHVRESRSRVEAAVVLHR